MNEEKLGAGRTPVGISACGMFVGWHKVLFAISWCTFLYFLIQNRGCESWILFDGDMWWLLPQQKQQNNSWEDGKIRDEGMLGLSKNHSSAEPQVSPRSKRGWKYPWSSSLWEWCCLHGKVTFPGFSFKGRGSSSGTGILGTGSMLDLGLLLRLWWH